MVANIHVYICTAVTTFFLLSNLSQILDVAFLLSVSIYGIIQHIPIILKNKDHSLLV